MGSVYLGREMSRTFAIIASLCALSLWADDVEDDEIHIDGHSKIGRVGLRRLLAESQMRQRNQ